MSTINNKKSSYISELRSEGRINESFLNTVSELKLEELIAIKIEMASRLFRGKLYGIPIWITMPRIVKEAMLHVAINSCKTKTDMCSFLGLTLDQFNDILKDYDLDL